MAQRNWGGGGGHILINKRKITYAGKCRIKTFIKKMQISTKVGRARGVFWYPF